MKKLLVPALALLFALSLAACSPAPVENKDDTTQLTVIATLFPQYDFARAVAGERATVSLLLPPGVESHSFEPTPADMAAMTEADLILYTGDAMEPWMARLSEALETPPVDLSAGIALDAVHEEAGDEADEHGHTHELDPHIWTDPTQAIVMVENIRAALSAADPEGAELYAENAAAYTKELQELDKAITEAAAGFSSHTVCFGGRFALHYFAKHYGFDYIAAYDSCSEETEPSAKAVADIIDAVRAQNIRAIYYEELTEPTVANSIAEETGTKALLLHSCHNVSKSELEAGATYLSLMYQNLENLKEGLA